MPALTQQLNSSALGLSCGASSGTSLAGLIKSLEEGGGAWSAAANAPVPPVSPDPPRPTGTVVNADTMQGKLNPQALTCTDEGERCCSWALQLPWPRAPPVSGLLAGLRSHHCNTQGVGARGLWGSRRSRWEGPPHGKAWHGVNALLRECKRVLVESERKRPCEGHPQGGRDPSGHGKKTTK